MCLALHGGNFRTHDRIHAPGAKPTALSRRPQLHLLQTRHKQNTKRSKFSAQRL